MARLDIENDSILVTIPQWSDKNKCAPDNDSQHVSVAGYLEATNERTEVRSVDVLRGSNIGKDIKDKGAGHERQSNL